MIVQIKFCAKELTSYATKYSAFNAVRIISIVAVILLDSAWVHGTVYIDVATWRDFPKPIQSFIVAGLLDGISFIALDNSYHSVPGGTLTADNLVGMAYREMDACVGSKSPIYWTERMSEFIINNPNVENDHPIAAILFATVTEECKY